MKTRLDAALEYLDRGWSVFPIRPDTKQPRIKWGDLQHRLPTEEEVTGWWSSYPNDDIALATGKVSGFYVVDCDNEEALAVALHLGWHTPVRTRTKKGWHLWFADPKDGAHRGPKVGSKPGDSWVPQPGLDFRGDGGYVVLPSPGNPYQFEIALGHDFDDAPVWFDWVNPGQRRPLPVYDNDTPVEQIDLSGVRPRDPNSLMDQWERAEHDAAEFPSGLIPSNMGNARNQRVMLYISECIKRGYWEDDLRAEGLRFMDAFFEERLSDRYFEATVKSMMAAERRNHPERFNAQGDLIARVRSLAASGEAPDTGEEKKEEVTPAPQAPRVLRFITMADKDALLQQAQAKPFIIDPWLPAGGTIIQLYGFSGAGKSTILQNILGAASAGQREWGPWDITAHEPPRVLYMNYEEGKRTIAYRLEQLGNLYGNTNGNLKIFTPWLEPNIEYRLSTEGGLNLLQQCIVTVRPDIVVIDTVRSAWPGMDENDSKAWTPINELAKKLRNAGVCVIMLHHANKPGMDGLGRESGSSNQLTDLEVQIRISQVFANEDKAKVKGGIWAGKLGFDDFYLHDFIIRKAAQINPALDPSHPDAGTKFAKATPLDYLIFKANAAGYNLAVAYEIRYPKVREWSEAYDWVNLIGLGKEKQTGAEKWFHLDGARQFVRRHYQAGLTPSQLSELVIRPQGMIEEWLKAAP